MPFGIWVVIVVAESLPWGTHRIANQPSDLTSRRARVDFARPRAATGETAP